MAVTVANNSEGRIPFSPKPETASMSTSMIAVATQDSETMTEVRKNIDNKICPKLLAKQCKAFVEIRFYKMFP